MEVIAVDFSKSSRQPMLVDCTSKVLPFKKPSHALASMSTIMRPTDKVLLLRLEERLVAYTARADASKRVRARAEILWHVLRKGSYDLGLVKRDADVPFIFYRNAFISVKKLCEEGARNYI